ncbi:DNA-directed RNA polymerase III subunit RPC3 [Diachasma alloeum]|uniref:DNA-directed RNA polymerase III subunit RPC3 n=1 Tax=Diachasma alloeum TaxID=454923 RepID=UPI000738131F|nr:DNA-directed RNA polymerase III subunit RPC3 [Diachasma alloeum]
MSFYCGKLCSAILLEHFGSIVQSVGDCLYKNSSQGLHFVTVTTGIPLVKVKEALCVLIKYGFVFHEMTEKGMRYTLLPDNITMVLRYSRFMFFVKKCCGDEGEIMLEEILKQGYDTASQVIVKAYTKMLQRLGDAAPSLEFLKEKFELLIKNQFVMRSSCTDEMGEITTDKPDFLTPTLNLRALKGMVEGIKVDPGDNKVHWRVNFDRLIQDLRDKTLVEAVSRMVDDNAGEMMRQMLFLMYERTASWADTSNPIPYIEIKEKVKGLDISALTQYLDQYLRLIEEDSRQFLRRVGDSGGGQFSVNVKEAFAQLAWATLENIVMERFGSKAARIFRLVKSKKYIEVEQIQQLAMIPAKEAKHLTFILFQENYLQMQEVKKAGVSQAPLKAFFLFHIELNQVVRMEMEHCYHALYNTMQRREHETVDNRRMIEKQLRIQTLISNLKERGAPEEQLQEIEEMMTPAEKLQLDKVHNIIKTLGGAELQIEETLFLFFMYLHYH